MRIFALFVILMEVFISNCSYAKDENIILIADPKVLAVKIIDNSPYAEGFNN